MTDLRDLVDPAYHPAPGPRVGDKIETWFSGEPDGKSRVLAVEPYRGRYTEFFTHVVRVTAPNTRRGWMEMSV